jgi:cob(I)alamin adenosyltransferase
MVRINKVITRSGDSGSTAVLGKGRISKASQRIEAMGTVDELISWIGLAKCEVAKIPKSAEIAKLLKEIQNDLFDLGSELAAAAEVKTPLPVTSKMILALEKATEKYNKNLPALTSFILPGSSSLNAWLHISRSVTRRAERQVVKLNSENSINPLIQIYLNRLSDLFFVLSRKISLLEETQEVLWDNRKK